MRESNKALKNGFALLMFYVYWSFIFSETILTSTIARQVFSAFILFLFLLGLINTTRKSGLLICYEGFLWIPYIVVTIIGLVFAGAINAIMFWIIATIVLIVASNVQLDNYFSPKQLAIFGVIAFLGILVQMFFKSLYYGRLIYFFNDRTISDIRAWSGHTGYAGFTYQLAMTAAILIGAEAAFYYFYCASDTKKQKHIFMLACIICILGVFLTGKRTMSLVALLTPIFISVLSKERTGKKMMYELIIIGVVVGAYFFMILNADKLVNTRALGRIAESLVALRTGDDFSNGRNELYSSAIDAFLQHPILGIGIDNFTEYTGHHTAVHNSYLQILCEQGIVGGMLFIVPLIAGLVKSLKTFRANLKTDKRAVVCLGMFFQIYFVLYSFTGNTTSDLFGYIIYYLGLGLIISCRKSYE